MEHPKNVELQILNNSEIINGKTKRIQKVYPNDEIIIHNDSINNTENRLEETTLEEPILEEPILEESILEEPILEDLIVS